MAKAGSVAIVTDEGEEITTRVPFKLPSGRVPRRIPEADITARCEELARGLDVDPKELEIAAEHDLAVEALGRQIRHPDLNVGAFPSRRRAAV